MNYPQLNIRDLLESGAHFGHQTQRWNPRMAPFIYGPRHGIHIIDLRETLKMFTIALKAVRATAAAGGQIMFVGTKKQAVDHIADSAMRAGQPYVNQRWLGGTLTNWKTVSKSIERLKLAEADLEKYLIKSDQKEDFASGRTKKEVSCAQRDIKKKSRDLEGISNMTKLPGMLFIIDTNKEKTAVQEAKKLGIPVLGIVDTNSDPWDIAFPVPANDDSAKAIKLYCNLVTRAVIDGIQDELSAAGVDIGEAVNPVSSSEDISNLVE